jgi:hypothetical protein
MGGVYPHFKASYAHEELVEHFLLSPADLQFVFGCRMDANRCGMALLLKTLDYLGYIPGNFDEAPPEVCSFVAGLLRSIATSLPLPQHVEVCHATDTAVLVRLAHLW